MGCRLSGPWMGDGMGVRAQDLSHLQQREAFRILASYEQPITLQIEGRRRRSLQYYRTADCSTQTERLWDPVRTPLSDRSCYSHMTLPGSHRYDFLPSSSRDPEQSERARYSENDEFSPSVSQGQNCLIGCCNTNLEEPRSFPSQADEDEYLMEKPAGFLPLHHELDSGLGWTDGSFHQGELSGVETEEGLEECRHPTGGSPSSESFISSELSDSGFYSVSTGEFLRFQRLLEKRMRHYNARMHHQGEPCSRERRDSQIKHRELEAIPEALTVQPPHAQMPPGSRCLSRVSSVQYRKAEPPCLNHHSSSHGSLFTPPAHPASAPAGMLRRSRTLHHQPVPPEYRRRASHPASPNYCSTTLHHCGHRVTLPMHVPEGALMYPDGRSVHAVSQPSLVCAAVERDSRAELQPQRSCVMEQPPGRFHTLSHTPSQEANDTWPKPAARSGPSGGGGLYSTLEGHIPNAAARKPPSANVRAMRSQMMRDRASRLADERSGMSTDEESHGDARLGRYWSRTERREHVLQKQRQQQQQGRGGGSCASLLSGVGGASADSSYNAVLELSQRKLSRLRNRKVLDDWTTVEELLTHGTRLGAGEDVLQLPASLLTVTTV